MSITIKQPAYIITVRDFLASFIATRNADMTPNFEMDTGEPATKKVIRLPVVKSVGLAPDVSSVPIHASGMVYDLSTRLKSAQLTLGVVALPADFKDAAVGTTIISGSMAYQKNNDLGKEFACGYYMEESDGGLVYYIHPRCKLIQGEEEAETSSDDDLDPEESYAIEVLPTHEGVWRIRYRTKDVATGKTPLTVDAFFAAMPYTIAEITALAATEQAAG